MGRILFTNIRSPIDDDLMREHVKSALERGLPFVGESPIQDNAILAVLGGGPSINQHVDELREWPSDIWAINGSWVWAKNHGIDATFFSVCAGIGWSDVLKQPVNGKAMLAPWCEPYLFDMWSGDVKIIPEEKIRTGSTSATAAWILGPLCGFPRVVFFGCESSYESGSSHAYDFYDHLIKDNLVVRVSDKDYLTTPQLLLQAEYMSHIIRTFPDIYSERSGGLLSALVQNPDYDLVAASPRIANSLVEVKANT